MLGPRYVLTSYQKKLFDMDYEKHKKRLNTIQTSKRKINEDKDKVFRATFSDLQSKHALFQNVEKVGSIDKTNQLLLDKLVKISKNQKPTLYKTVSWSSHPGTLNTNFRKRELEKIALENESMAKRLISQHGSVNIKRLEGDFEKHRQFSKNVQKVLSPTSPKLPALNSPKPTESPKKKQKKERRLKTQEDHNKQDLDTVTQESQPVEAPTETETHSVAKIHIPIENTSQPPAQSANQTSQEIKEEVAPATNQASQRTQKEVSSHIKSSGDISVSQQEETENKDEKVEKKDPKKDSERATKRSGTLQYSNKFLGDSKDSKEASRRTSTHIPARKPSTIKVPEKSEHNKSVEQAEEGKSSRKEIESQAPKSERMEEKEESSTPKQSSNKGEQSHREESAQEKEAEKLVPVDEQTEEKANEEENK